MNTLAHTSRLTAAFARSTPKLVAYFPCSDPLLPIELLDVFAECGVDIVELGLASKSPYVDGEIVSASMARTTGDGTLKDAAEALARIASHRLGMAKVIFAYASQALLESFETSALDGIDAVLCAPLPGTDLDTVIETTAARQDIGVCRFAPFDFDAGDIARARTATGYVMLQAAPGKTGARETFDPANSAHVRRLRQEGVAAPILLGIGLSHPEHARQAIEAGADGVIIGSKIIAEALEGPASLADYLRQVRAALDD